MNINLKNLHITFTDNGVTDSLKVDLSDTPQHLTRFPPKDDLITVVCTIDGLLLKDTSRTTPLEALTELNDCAVCVTVVSVFTVSLSNGIIASESKIAVTNLREISSNRAASHDTYASLIDKINRCVVGVDAFLTTTPKEPV